jgi:predicted RNase H-like HicB family nuclease
MKTRDLLIRCLAVREGEHWVAICLPFDLAAQGESLSEAKRKLSEQIREYLHDALIGQDREHAELLVTRSAPAKYWLMYGVARLAHSLRNIRPFRAAMPLELAAC